MAVNTIEQRLNRCLATGSKAERRIATFMLANIAQLPFDTAASISKRIGVSEPTVGRFCRTLGYQNFKALKDDLQHDVAGGPWLIGDRLKEFHDRSKGGEDQLGRGLELEIASLVRIYELARTEQWARAVGKIARSHYVFVAGFQTERGSRSILPISFSISARTSILWMSLAEISRMFCSMSESRRRS